MPRNWRRSEASRLYSALNQRPYIYRGLHASGAMAWLACMARPILKIGKINVLSPNRFHDGYEERGWECPPAELVGD
jgi:hypothetical protein